MSLAKLYTKPGHLIRRLQQIAVGAFLAEAGELGLTPVQYAALCGVRESEGVDIRRLAEIIALDRSTLGGTVARLAERGLLEQAPNPKDRRQKLLRVTTAGRRLLERAEPRVRMAQTRMLERLPEEDRGVFTALLVRLVDLNNSLSRAPAKAGPGTGAPLSLYAKPGHLIRRLQQISDAIFAEIDALFDITPLQYASLVAIGEYPGLDNTRLSYLIALDRATVGSVVKRLEGKGLISRAGSETDRRAMSLQITAEGEALLRRMQPHIDHAETRITASLGRQDRLVFMRLLTTVVNLGNDISRAPHRWVDLRDVG
jgi:DNA-binding MarR family transcriptional regulator